MAKIETDYNLKAFATVHDAFDKCRIEMLIEKFKMEYYSLEPCILDIGCGSGVTSLHIKKKHPRVALVGLDFSRNALKVAKNICGKSAEFICGDAQNLPFKTNTFNGAVAGEVMEHLPDDITFLKEVYRVLKQGATLILSTPGGRRLSRDDMRFGHLRVYRSGKLRKMLQNTGFTQVRIVKWGFILLRVYLKIRKATLRHMGLSMFLSEGKKEEEALLSKSKPFRVYILFIPLLTSILRLDYAPSDIFAKHLIVQAEKNAHAV